MGQHGVMTDRVTPAEIVDAAIGLLALGGLHALGMRRIASELGIQQSALYWHFDNKQQLLAAVADRVLAGVEAPSDDDRSQRIEGLASRLRAALLRYPDGAELVGTTFAFRLGARQPFRELTGELERAGLARGDAEVAASVVVHFVIGYTTDEQQHHQAAALGAIDRASDEHPWPSADDHFTRGLRIIIAGVEAQIESTR